MQWGTGAEDSAKGYSLSREHRLTRRPEFQSCYETGRRYFSRNFVLFVLRRTEGVPQWRMGCAVTRKTGNAVRRNRIKRVLREFFRLYGQRLPAFADIVVVPKRQLDPSRVTLAMVLSELGPLLSVFAETLPPGAMS